MLCMPYPVTGWTLLKHASLGSGGTFLPAGGDNGASSGQGEKFRALKAREAAKKAGQAAGKGGEAGAEDSKVRPSRNGVLLNCSVAVMRTTTVSHDGCLC